MKRDSLTFLMFIATVVILSGCGGHDPEKPKPVHKIDLPPVFNYGDMVVPLGGKKLCIITDRRQDRDKDAWVYTVMHQDRTFTYDENQLKLFNHFDWEMNPKVLEILEEDVKAEIESDEEIP